MALVARFGLKCIDIRGADCSLAELVGDFVYLVGPPVGGRDQVRKVDPSDVLKMPAVGVIINKLTDTFCQVQWMGETPAIFESLTTGKPHYVGPDARVTGVVPISPTGLFAQIVGLATSPTRFYVRPENHMTRLQR